MNKVYWGLCAGMVLLGIAYAAKPIANEDDVRIVPLDPTAEPEHVTLRTFFPKKDELEKSEPVEMQVRIEGFPLGVMSDFPRKREVFNSHDGQTIRIIVDNAPFFSKNTTYLSSMDDSENYYEQILEVDLPHLQPGEHIVRVFPARSFGESLKGDGCFQADVFYIKSKTPSIDVNLNGPYLTYNEPQGEYPYNEQEPILLDFYLTNCQLSEDGYKVRLSIDGKNQRMLTDWRPYAIYGMTKGEHKIRLELLNPEGNLVPGLFNNTMRSIVIR